MENYNYSSSKYTVGKRQGQEWINLTIRNSADVSRTFSIHAYDGDTNEALLLYAGDKETNQETIEPNSLLMIKINAAKAAKIVTLELSSNGGGAGITVRQRSSSNKVAEDGIELILK